MTNRKCTFVPGDVIDGRYLIRGSLGRGGEGCVYRVTDLKLGKDWAMKAVAADHEDPAGRDGAALYHEAGMLRTLSHPCLPRITDIVTWENGICIVMDLIEGRTLAELLDKEGAQPQEKVLIWARQLGEVLQYLHTRKPPVIYRDMKPSNIMLRQDGDIVLFDFGIALEQKNTASGETVCLGTYGYAAPEQYGGQDRTSERTDIYGLGATLYHLLSGQSPADPPYEMRPLREIDPGIWPGLERIVRTCTMYDPAKRYESAAAFLKALDEVREMKKTGTEVEGMARGRTRRTYLPVLGTALFMAVSAVLSYKTVRAEKREAYTAAMTDAADLAADSIGTGNYDPAVTARYTEAIGIDKDREDAYLSLIDYMESIGQTGAGLRCVTARLDAPDGTISGSDEVILAVAELYFAGSDTDPSFVRNYGKAAKYYAAVDPAACPQAPYFASIARILDGFSDAVDWKEALAEMKKFEACNAAQPLTVSRIRNDRILAGVYLTNRREMDRHGTDACAEAIRLLTGAMADAENLAPDPGTDHAAEITTIRKKILWDLAGAYAAGSQESISRDPDEAVRCLSALLDLTEDEDEACGIRMRMAACAALAGKDEEVRRIYETLMADHPAAAAPYVEYAAYLLSAGDGSGAAAVYRKAQDLADAEEEPNFASVGMKLKNAGLL